ncbi:MAG: hypothetical protein QHG99_07260 [Methanomicrobiales archaeon]|nr:hypothetical protein [Methanomicrobiales archaeon]
MDLKKMLALMAGLLALTGVASAYYVNISAPARVSLGEVIEVTGESNLPPGLTRTVMFASSGNFPRVIAQKDVVIQANGSFSTSFETRGLSKGMYKVEIVEGGQYTYGSSSRYWRFVEILDRSEELKVTNPRTQLFDGTLEIAGTLQNAGDEGVEVIVTSGGETVYGPVYIATAMGAFSADVQISKGGTYTVVLKDRSGYRWTFDIAVTVPATPTPMPTPLPTTEAFITASGTSTRAEPAYFEIRTLPGNLIVTTSSGVDWVVEYIDEDNRPSTVNTRGTSSERLELQTRGGKIYLKVYPDQFSERAEVTISATNATSIRNCPECASFFGARVTETPTAPLPVAVTLLAILFILMRKR